MTERIKDFIYDCSDIILTLVIIGCMFLVISWKVTDIMGMPLYPESEKAASITDHNDTNDIVDIDNVKEENNDVLDSDIIMEPVTEPDTLPDVSKLEVKNITIEIPKGTLGVGIAKILLEKGLIDDTSKFIHRVEELELAPKLRFGTFNLKSNNSIDEIIHILTGTK